MILAGDHAAVSDGADVQSVLKFARAAAGFRLTSRELCQPALLILSTGLVSLKLVKAC